MPEEVQEPHSRILKCALEVEDARAYWRHADPEAPARPQEAFDAYWFGARSLSRVEVLLSNFRLRFDAFPPSLQVLRHWADADPETRTAICHWHLQLADPLYRRFTGDYLPERRASHRPEVTRDVVLTWVASNGPLRFTMSTRVQLASKLLSSAYAAGLVGSNRDPRPLPLPRISDEALTYLVYLLRRVRFEGSLLDNPYLVSVGLTGGVLEDRLRALPALRFRAQAGLVDFGWTYPDLESWAGIETHARARGTA